MAGQKNLMQQIGLALGPVLFVLINLLDLEPGNPAVTRMAAVAARAPLRGGFALAYGFQVTGLSILIGNAFARSGTSQLGR